MKIGFTFHYFAIYLWQKSEYDLFCPLSEKLEALNTKTGLFFMDLISNNYEILYGNTTIYQPVNCILQ